MSKALSNLLTVFKVAKIVAKVVFILCIIGCAGCVLGVLLLYMTGDLLVAEVFVEEGLSLPAAYLGCIVGAIVCAAEVVFAFLAERYFGNVLNAGTPFTFEGAKESFRLGIASIIISVATSAIAGITSLVFLVFTTSAVAESDVSVSFSISMGLFFLFLSLIFKHGAELKAASAEEPQQETEKAEIE